MNTFTDGYIHPPPCFITRMQCKRVAVVELYNRIVNKKNGVAVAIETINKLLADAVNEPITANFLKLKKAEAEAELQQLEVNLYSIIGRIHQLDEFINEEIEIELENNYSEEAIKNIKTEILKKTEQLEAVIDKQTV